MGLPKLKGENAENNKKVEVISFRFSELDIYLPKLIREGNRVAICEQLEAPKQSTERTPQEEINQEIRTGRHM